MPGLVYLRLSLKDKFGFQIYLVDTAVASEALMKDAQALRQEESGAAPRRIQCHLAAQLGVRAITAAGMDA
jgi:hypothetical protein